MLPVIYFPALQNRGDDVPAHLAFDASAEPSQLRTAPTGIPRSTREPSSRRPAAARLTVRQLPLTGAIEA
jgi:hypothetical protein